MRYKIYKNNWRLDKMRGFALFGGIICGACIAGFLIKNSSLAILVSMFCLGILVFINAFPNLPRK